MQRMPVYELLGVREGGDEILFGNSNDGWHTIAGGTDIYLRANTDFLSYVISENRFYAGLFGIQLGDPASPFYDPDLFDAGSAFLDGVSQALDPSMPGALGRNLYSTFTPSVNFFALTNEFTQSGESSGDDLEFVAHSAPDPGSSLLLLGMGLAGLRAWKKRLG
jgi:hypothetical protein